VEESAERPPMDLFKAIFENSESSSSSSEAGSDDEDNQQMDADSRKAAVNDVRPDTVSNIAAAVVPEAAPVTMQHPPQQQDYGMMIVLSMNLTSGYAMVVHGHPKTPKNTSFLGVTQPQGVTEPLYSMGHN